MFNKPEAKPDFNQLELAVLAWWKQNKILEKSINQRSDENIKTFYDGPITANGAPHNGHIVTFSEKDIIPRYWTMQGYKVSRSLGWDCQGLPVEYEIEKKLGFKEKSDIEKYGIEKFNELCRASVYEFKDKIVELEDRIGRLTNDEETYATMDSEYIESIWWSLKTIYDKGLMYEGFKVVPYSTRAGTTLSNAEVALGGYKEYTDPAVTVKFELSDEPGTFVLAWTTTPWTLPTNFALAIGEKIDYVSVEHEGAKYVLAKDLVSQYFPAGITTKSYAREQLVGKKYKTLFDFFPDKKNAYQIVYGQHVTTDNGTGVVHLAPYGAEDVEIFKKLDIEVVDVLDDQGNYTELIPNYAGMNYRDANPQIVEALKAKDLLFKYEDYVHEMPMCWRTNTPLIYKPITAWYIAMSKLRTNLVNNNNTVSWMPDHMKNGRFGNWLSEIKDWGISRKRYWATPLPIWKSPTGKVKVVGSFQELKELSGVELKDPHRPFVDDVTFELDGEKYTRIVDVLDVWYDSGAMPFARFHYPFENKEKFERKFPAQLIAEGVDQTRGWFYSLMAISTALFDKSPFESVIVNGFVVDDKGQKLSKSKKNYEPYEVLLNRYGADTLRSAVFSSPILAGEDAPLSDAVLKIQVQEFMLVLWNTYSYLTTYANIHGWAPSANLARNQRLPGSEEAKWDHIPFADITNELDAWLILELQNTIAVVTENLDKHDVQKAARALSALLTQMSKWYIRRSRDRFAGGDVSAMETLYYVLIEFMKLAAPFIPYTTEHIYRELVANQFSDLPESIHLTDYPAVDLKFTEEFKQISPEMQLVREIAELGQTLRTTNALKVRQPLAKLEVQSSLEGFYLSDWMKQLLADELNVLEVVEVPQLNTGESFKVTEARNGQLKVGLDSALTPELEAAGTLREVIRSIQAQRKAIGLQMGEEANVQYQTSDEKLVQLINDKKTEIMSAVSAGSLVPGNSDVELMINGAILKLTVSKT